MSDCLTAKEAQETLLDRVKNIEVMNVMNANQKIPEEPILNKTALLQASAYFNHLKLRHLKKGFGQQRKVSPDELSRTIEQERRRYAGARIKFEREKPFLRHRAYRQEMVKRALHYKKEARQLEIDLTGVDNFLPVMIRAQENTNLQRNKIIDARMKKERSVKKKMWGELAFRPDGKLYMKKLEKIIVTFPNKPKTQYVPDIKITPIINNNKCDKEQNIQE